MTPAALVSFATQTASTLPPSEVSACSKLVADFSPSQTPGGSAAGVMPAASMTSTAPSWNILALPSAGSPPM